MAVIRITIKNLKSNVVNFENKYDEKKFLSILVRDIVYPNGGGFSDNDLVVHSNPIKLAPDNGLELSIFEFCNNEIRLTYGYKLLGEKQIEEITNELSKYYLFVELLKKTKF